MGDSSFSDPLIDLYRGLCETAMLSRVDQAWGLDSTDLGSLVDVSNLEHPRVKKRVVREKNLSKDEKRNKRKSEIDELKKRQEKEEKLPKRDKRSAQKLETAKLARVSQDAVNLSYSQNQSPASSVENKNSHESITTQKNTRQIENSESWINGFTVVVENAASLMCDNLIKIKEGIDFPAELRKALLLDILAPEVLRKIESIDDFTLYIDSVDLKTKISTHFATLKRM